MYSDLQKNSAYTVSWLQARKIPAGLRSLPLLATSMKIRDFICANYLQPQLEQGFRSDVLLRLQTPYLEDLCNTLPILECVARSRIQPWDKLRDRKEFQQFVMDALKGQREDGDVENHTGADVGLPIQTGTLAGVGAST